MIICKQEHKTDEMHTALMEASMDGHVEVARLLLDSGAQVNMPADRYGHQRVSSAFYFVSKITALDLFIFTNTGENACRNGVNLHEFDMQ